MKGDHDDRNVSNIMAADMDELVTDCLAPWVI